LGAVRPRHAAGKPRRGESSLVRPCGCSPMISTRASGECSTAWGLACPCRHPQRSASSSIPSLKLTPAVTRADRRETPGPEFETSGVSSPSHGALARSSRWGWLRNHGFQLPSFGDRFTRTVLPCTSPRHVPPAREGGEHQGARRSAACCGLGPCTSAAAGRRCSAQQAAPGLLHQQEASRLRVHAASQTRTNVRRCMTDQDLCLLRSQPPSSGFTCGWPGPDDTLEVRACVP